MTLHMVQLSPDMPRFIRWAEQHRLLHQRLEDDLGYALHALLRAAFDTLAPSPFAFTRRPARAPTLLAYSAHPGAALREQAAAFAEPDVVAAIGLGGLADKQMPDCFGAGRRLGFTVRARPTVRVDREGDRDSTRERDAFLAAIDSVAQGNGPTRGEVYQGWLAQRLAGGGAKVEHVVLDAFRLSTTLRRDATRKIHAVRGPEAEFSGVLSVTEPDRFVVLLSGGVGRHRAFGFGMLLLRPA
jgi:CRISPR system Cascade subunit CasE